MIIVQSTASLLKNFFHIRYFINKFIVANAYKLKMSETLINADMEQIESSHFQDIQEKAQRFLTAEGFGGVLDKAFDLLSQIIVIASIMYIIISLDLIVSLVLFTLLGINFFANSKVKKANVELDLKRAEQERRMCYFFGICGNIHYAKEIRLENMGSWINNKLVQRSQILKEFYAKSINNNLWLFSL